MLWGERKAEWKLKTLGLSFLRLSFLWGTKVHKFCEEASITFVLYFLGATQTSVSMNVISTFLYHHAGTRRYTGGSKEE